MSGGKGGSTTTKVEIPAWLEDAAKSNLARADEIAKIGYTPYFGPDVAALTPMQQAAMRNTNSAASAFGMAAPSDPMAGMPAAQDFGGVQGYSAAPLYQGSVDALRASNPAQYDAIRSMFIDPQTGAQPRSPFGGQPAPAQAAAPVNPYASNGSSGRDDDRNSYSGGGSSSTTSIHTPLSYAPGGVNTRNPSSVVNRAAAALSGPQGAPTASNRPVARPSGSSGSSSGMGGGK